MIMEVVRSFTRYFLDSVDVAPNDLPRRATHRVACANSVMLSLEAALGLATDASMRRTSSYVGKCEPP